MCFQVIKRYISTTSQVGQSHLGTSCDVLATSQVCQSYLGNSWYVAITSQIGRFYLGASETSWKISKYPSIQVSKYPNVVVTSQCGPRCPNLNETKMRRLYDVACWVGKYQFLINKRESTGLNYFNDSKTFIKLCTSGQNSFIKIRAYIVHQLIEH